MGLFGGTQVKTNKKEFIAEYHGVDSGAGQKTPEIFVSGSSNKK